MKTILSPLVLILACGCGSGLPTGTGGSAPISPPCVTVADCPASMLAHTQCSVLRCGLADSGEPLGCYLAPAVVGSPCQALNDAGVVACEGTCDAKTLCVFTTGTGCGKPPLDGG